MFPHVVVQFQDEPVLLECGNEFRGTDHLPVVIDPAHQRFASRNGIGNQLKFRLEIYLELFFVQRSGESIGILLDFTKLLSERFHVEFIVLLVQMIPFALPGSKTDLVIDIVRICVPNVGNHIDAENRPDIEIDRILLEQQLHAINVVDYFIFMFAFATYNEHIRMEMRITKLLAFTSQFVQEERNISEERIAAFHAEHGVDQSEIFHIETNHHEFPSGCCANISRQSFMNF